MTGTEIDSAALVAALKALAHPTRLDVLRALRVPTRAADLRLSSGQVWGGLRPERPLTRPAIVHHIQQLEGLGFVERVDEGGRYMINQQKMFAFLEALGGLARIRPVIDIDVPETIIGGQPSTTPLAAAPRLLVVAGPKEGHSISLEKGGPWTIGRGKDADLRLEYDPHVSRNHVVLTRDEDAYRIEAAASAANPIFVNFQPLGPQPLRLSAGDILAVGSSRISFQP